MIIKEDEKKAVVKQDESESLDLLYTSLAKAQEEMETATTDKNNPFFKSKYADLTSIVRASRPFLSKNGLSVIQRITTNEEDNMYLKTRLCHMSGQWIESKMPINPVDWKIQSIGAYITYLKRYTLAAIVGVATDDANDDDGESAMDRNNNSKKKKDTLSDEEVKEICFSLNRVPEYKQEIDSFLNKQKISNYKDMTRETYSKVLKNANKKFIEISNEKKVVNA